QSLERVFGFVIHRASGAFGNLGGVEFGDDLIERTGIRFDGKRDVRVAERAIPLSVAGQIQRDDRNAFATRVAPDVALGPMQDWMHPQMRAGWRRCVEVVPELGRLVANVPG